MMMIWFICIFSPTGGGEPPGSGSGKPDRFNWEPENRLNSKSEQKHAVQTVPTGIPVRFDWEPVVEQKNRITGELDVFSNLN
jgi:hypothetical protein